MYRDGRTIGIIGEAVGQVPSGQQGSDTSLEIGELTSCIGLRRMVRISRAQYSIMQMI